MGQVNWLLTNELGLIGPVRNIAPTREMNVFIRFPSSLETFGCFLSATFRLLTRQTVEEDIFTQPSVVLEDSLPELCHRMSLTEDVVAEGDFVLEAAGPQIVYPSNRVRVIPISCGQLHLNGWDLLRTFERVCLYFEFRLTGRLLYIYDVLIPPSGYGFISFQARQGWGTPSLGFTRTMGLRILFIHSLDPLETAAFDFLVSLPAGLPKKNNLTCRWILDNPDAVVGKFLDDLLIAKMKKTKLDRMMAMMADPSRMVPWAILPTGAPSATTVAASAATSSATAEPSANPATPSVQVPPPPPASSRAKKSSSKRDRPEVVNVVGEESAKEDLEADLRQKRR
ncbi:hypothetical protein PIB30_035459 [Stylosanthes scabra]|uniref:Uncharacterized protein n=1 Tax=Stylosanthes scabra TaxID=79078 RepID=A0ABU6UBV0_9FABA|nr:hypothetical protein [Stylosanthes scabra]